MAYLLGALAIFVLGVNFYPYFYPHYIAAVACLFVLTAVLGLEILSRFPAGRRLAQLIVLLCAAQFLFWYGLHLTADDSVASAMARY